ncbi:MAG TPA: hypothetical protein VFQ43_00120 [Nitrososphaera sp.]|nr:hypothetical protein [Nitrososphaera sp.]
MMAGSATNLKLATEYSVPGEDEYVTKIAENLKSTLEREHKPGTIPRDVHP